MPIGADSKSKACNHYHKRNQAGAAMATGGVVILSLMNTAKPLVIAGPCAAESFETMDVVATLLKRLAAELDFDYVFKASFDKANRTTHGSNRGPGASKA